MIEEPAGAPKREKDPADASEVGSGTGRAD
jgi:hypothetical protein